MFEPIFNFLSSIWHALLPFYVIKPWEMGLKVRLGKVKGVLGPGLHWIIPFGVDEVWDDTVVPRTQTLEGATTTLDGKAIGYTAVITFRIKDIEKSLMEVHDVKDAVIDTCAGILGIALSNTNWEDIVHGRNGDELTRQCQLKGRKWGIEITSVQLAGVSIVKNLRLLGLNSHHDVQVEHQV